MDFELNPFHGFQFSSSGVCQHAPEFNCALPSLKAKVFSFRDYKGFIWLWISEEEPTKNIPWFTEIYDSFDYAQLKDCWDSDITRCIENQLDFMIDNQFSKFIEMNYLILQIQFSKLI